MSDEQDKAPEGQPIPPTDEAAAQKQAAEAKAEAVNAAAGSEANAGAVQQPADVGKTAPAAGEKKPMTDEEKAALKAAALEKAAAAKAAKAAAEAAGGAAPAAAPAKPKPAHEEDPNKPVWEKDPVSPTWVDGADDPLTQALKEEFGDVIESARSYAGDLTFQVRRDAIAQVCASLKNRHRFTYMVDLCGADYPKREPRFDVVYQLHNFETNRRIRLKVATDEATPVPTVSGVWRVANWPEREVYDMYGVRFEGHPDMTRILLWEGFNGYPLRKDFPVEGIDTGSAIYPEYYNETAGPVNNAGTGWKPAKPPEPPTPGTPPAGASETTK
ncbi:MAG TPA: NADH-quinone oxidoreductase subunit C [Thermoanaerobaculia bacterium]|nr:NADH-quinone oxidoreductase subunit C [Thermoanaerobaculia bacterium]